MCPLSGNFGFMNILITNKIRQRKIALKLMFVTTLEMDNFDCTKMNAHFKKFTASMRERLIYEWKHTFLAPPLPLMSVNNSRLCSTRSVPHTTTVQLSCALECSTNDTSCILDKAQPSTQSTGSRSPPRLGIRPQNLGLPNRYSLAHCGLSAASRHKLAFTSRHYTLLTAT